MLDGFLRSLFSRPAVLSEEVTEALEDLARLQDRRPALVAPATLLSEVLVGIYAEPISDAACMLDREHAAAKIAASLPLLHAERLAIDPRDFRRRWQHVCMAIAHHQHANTVDPVAEAVQHLEPEQLLTDLLTGRIQAVWEQAETRGLEPALTATVLRFTVFPLLSRVSARLASLRADRCWDHGYCPSCGSWPVLAEFRGLEQTRILRCGLCASEWQFPRLRCPFCGTQDHQRLGYFHVEGEESQYRAAVCETCRGYVKTINTLSPLSGPQILVADLATIHLNLAAAERGYAVPTFAKELQRSSTDGSLC